MKKKINIYINRVLFFINNQNSQRVLKRINLFLSFLCLILIFNVFKEYYESKDLNFQLSATEFMLVFILYLISGFIWTNYMNSVYGKNSWSYFSNWSFSRIGKYLPSGLGIFSIRLNQNLPKEKDAKKIISGLLEEQFLLPLISIPPLIICIFVDFYINKFFLFFASLLVCFFSIRYLYKKIKISKNSITDQMFSVLISQFLHLILFYVVGENIGYSNSLLIAFYYFLSSSLGLFFVGVPAGIGIREFIFFTATNSFMNDIVIFEFIIKVRFLFLCMDLLFGLFGMARFYIIRNKQIL